MKPETTPYPDPPSVDDLEKILANKYGSHSEPFLVYIGPGSKTKSVSYYVTYDGQLFVRDKRTATASLHPGCPWRKRFRYRAVPLSLLFVMQKRTNPADNSIVLQCAMARHKCKEYDQPVSNFINNFQVTILIIAMRSLSLGCLSIHQIKSTFVV